MYTKIVQSGDLLEIYEYEKEPTPKRFSVKRRRRYKRFTRSIRHLRATQKRFRGLVRASLALGRPALCTLTMLDVVGIAEAYKCFTAWGVRMRRAYGANIQWVAVPEFQKRGAVHYHVLIWGLPDGAITGEIHTRAIQNLWGHGYIDVIATDGSPKLSSYLGKYMHKAVSDERLGGKRSYFCSRNIVRPLLADSAISLTYSKTLWGGDIELTPEREFDTIYLGRCTYKRYTLSST